MLSAFSYRSLVLYIDKKKIASCTAVFFFCHRMRGHLFVIEVLFNPKPNAAVVIYLEI